MNANKSLGDVVWYKNNAIINSYFITQPQFKVISNYSLNYINSYLLFDFKNSNKNFDGVYTCKVEFETDDLTLTNTSGIVSSDEFELSFFKNGW